MDWNLMLCFSSLDAPTGIAVDWTSDNLYWTDSGSGRIEVSSNDGSQRRALIWKDLKRPHHIVLNPQCVAMEYCSEFGFKRTLTFAISSSLASEGLCLGLSLHWHGTSGHRSPETAEGRVPPSMSQIQK